MAPMATPTEAPQWMCMPCGYVYDPAVGDREHGLPPGVGFEELGPDFSCPLCGVGREEFAPI